MTEPIKENFGDRRHNPRRTEDQVTGKSKRKHFITVALSRHPVLAAFAIATTIAAIPLYMVLDAQSTIRDQATTNQAQQQQISDLLHRIQLNRAESTGTFCRTVNANGRANNRQTAALESIIIQSTKASRPFENVYRQFGLPPYKERLRQARRLAGKLDSAKVVILDCKAQVKQIQAETGPPGPHIPKSKK